MASTAFGFSPVAKLLFWQRPRTPRNRFKKTYFKGGFTRTDDR